MFKIRLGTKQKRRVIQIYLNRAQEAQGDAASGAAYPGWGQEDVDDCRASARVGCPTVEGTGREVVNQVPSYKQGFDEGKLYALEVFAEAVQGYPEYHQLAILVRLKEIDERKQNEQRS
ncbi:MAG: hypothetical protein OEY86_00985 [Nitrospira sp.]|nr:hypothetical protein [Nitrospira sp.]